MSPVYIPFKHPFLNGYSLTVPCGKCKWCLEKRQKEWAFRIYQEAKKSQSYFVLTLTYDNDSIPLYNGKPVLLKKDLQLFNKRVREDLRKNFGILARFFAVGEYGGKYDRPHYHVFYFFSDVLSYDDFVILCLRNWHYCDRYVLMRGCEIPGRGMMYYTAQYSLKNFGINDYWKDLPKQHQPFMICSNRPAIGYCYLTPQMVDYHRRGNILYGTLEDGVKVPLPRYYKNKIWSEKERKRMFSRLLLEHGDIPNTELDKFIDAYGDISEAHKQFVNSYNDDYKSALRLFKDKRKL